MHKSFLSVLDDIELKLKKVFEGLHLILNMFERNHCQNVRNQLNRYSTDINQILKQTSDHLMLHDKDIFPDIVSSHFNVFYVRNISYLTSINTLIYSLNNLTSVDMKIKESFAEFIGKFFLKMLSEF